MICVSIAHISFEELMKIISEFEMIELRLDLLDFSRQEYQEIINTKKTIIATYRNETKNDTVRINELKSLISLGVQYVDIEIDSTSEYKSTMIEFAKKNSCQTILSYHNFEETPSTSFLQSIIEESKILKANLCKIATKANSKKDIVRTLSLYDKHPNIIAFNLGELGKVSRISCPFLGAKFTYASISEEYKTAEGQISFEDLSKITQIIR